MPTSKKITVTAALRGHQFAATLTLTTSLTGFADLFCDGKRVALAHWSAEGFAPFGALVVCDDIDDSEDALAALKRALVDRLMQDETYSQARAALFA